MVFLLSRWHPIHPASVADFRRATRLHGLVLNMAHPSAGFFLWEIDCLAEID
jgi:hypothetical protein